MEEWTRNLLEAQNVLQSSEGRAWRVEPETATEFRSPMVLPGLEGKQPAEPLAPTRTFRVAGKIPSEIWNRLGTKILPKLRSGTDLQIGIEFSVTVDSTVAKAFESEMRQILDDLNLADKVKME